MGDLAKEKVHRQKLEDSTGFGFHVSTTTLGDVIDVYSRIRNVIKHIVAIDAELLIVESSNANAFVAIRYDKPVI